MPANPGTWDSDREYARRHLPRGVFDFVDGAAESEYTARENRRAFEDLAFKPRVLAGNGERDQTVTVLGQMLRTPVIAAPTGMARMTGPGGEAAAARGADLAGTVSILSAVSSVPLEKVVAAADRPPWIQAYLFKDEGRSLKRIAEAKAQGVQVLVLTADTPVPGNRERDRRNGMTIPFSIRPRMMANALRRPRWLANYLLGPALVDDADDPGTGIVGRVIPSMDQSLVKVMSGVFNPDQSWDDLRRFRDLWDGPLVLKGVMCAEDARLAIDGGCEGVVVSNHGGRQLDGVPATIDVLPEVVAEIGGEATVLLDGGVRRGSDVVKALALGASACLVGRPWLFGLARNGAEGVADVFRTFAEEIDRVMALTGVRRPSELSPAVLRRRTSSGWTDLAGQSRERDH